MKKFDENYILLEEMYSDGYFPDFLVDKVKNLICHVISLLESGVFTILQSSGTNLVFIATSPSGFSVIFPSTIATVYPNFSF